MLLVKQRVAQLVPGWVTQIPCSGAGVGLASIRPTQRFPTFNPLLEITMPHYQLVKTPFIYSCCCIS